MSNVVNMILLCVFLSAPWKPQVMKPVKWLTSIEKVSESEFCLIITAMIDDGWHLYAQHMPENGPIPTKFSFKIHDDMYKLLGKTIEEKGHGKFDNVFGMNIKYFKEQATFKQRIKVKAMASERANISATVRFMVCDNSICLPPVEEYLVFTIPPRKSKKK